MRKRANPVKELRESQIKEAALKLFSKKGFHKTTITEIAEAADLSKGAIYWYWKSKEELAFSLVEDMLSGFLYLIEEARDEGGDYIERLDELIGKVTELYYLKEDHCRLLWKFRADRHYIFNPDYAQKVTALYVRIREAIADLVRQGIDSGDFRGVDPKFVAFIIHGVIEGLELEWLENQDEFSLREGLKTAIELMIEGFRK